MICIGRYITVVLTSSLVTAGLTGQAAASDKTEKLKLRDGHSLSRSGSIKNGSTLTYKFAGKKGQSLSLNFVATRGSCGFDIYSPGMAVPMFLGGSGVGAFSGKLPSNGDYRVKIQFKQSGSTDRCEFNVTFKSRT
jgi:hypothetical protein